MEGLTKSRKGRVKRDGVPAEIDPSNTNLHRGCYGVNALDLYSPQVPGSILERSCGYRQGLSLFFSVLPVRSHIITI
jgi:hypothetical protein